MPSTLIRLAVALLTFGLGVSATMFWIAYRSPDVSSFEGIPRHAHPLPPPPPLPTIEEELPPPPPKPLVRISGRLIDGEVIRKPAPAFPAAAAGKAGASGMALVEVHVVVGANGRVDYARALSGDPLLWPAAEEAAYQAEFEPPLVQGEPAFMTGTLSYNFAFKRTRGR